jgi:sulfonate transport system ATP-binding protein
MTDTDGGPMIGLTSLNNVHTGAGPAAELRNIEKDFDGRRVLRGVDLEVRAGEFVALLGASGSGKTTILRMMLGLEEPDTGQVNVPIQRTTVFQEPRLVDSMRVWRNVVIGLRRRVGTRERAVDALAGVNLDHLADSWPRTLSGGEAQRVALARALVRHPKLLLLDEPFAALDALTRLRMQALVGQLIDQYRPGVLLVTHDVEEAILLADRVLVLRQGQIVFNHTVNITRPRRVGGEDFDSLRERLLAELGVVRSDGIPTAALDAEIRTDVGSRRGANSSSIAPGLNG